MSLAQAAPRSRLLRARVVLAGRGAPLLKPGLLPPDTTRDMDVGRTSVLSERTGPSNAPGAAPHTMVVFELDGREFALPLREVVEILRMVAITPVPEVPRWVVGVINLRGRVIPVIDLRRRLGIEPAEPGLNTPILVVEQGARKLGLIADAVRDVLALPDEALEPPDGVDDGDTGHVDVVSAIARIGDRLVVVLDLDRVTADAAPLAEARNVTDAG